MRPSALAALLACLLPSTPLLQAQQKRAVRIRNSAEALRAWQDALELPEAQRGPVLSRIGRFKGAELTRALTDAFDAAETPAYRSQVLRALIRVPRHAAFDILVGVLDDAQGNYSDRSYAANGLGALGERGVDALIARTGVPAISFYVMRGLARSKSEKAWAAIRSLAREAEPNLRRQALTQLASRPASEELTALRLAAAREADLPLRLEALKQLAADQHPDTRSIALEVHEALTKSSMAQSYGLRLAEIFAADLQPEVFEPFLVQLANGSRNAERFMTEFGKTMPERPAFVSWLAAQANRRELPGERLVLVDLLSRASSAPALEALQKLARSRDKALALPALRGLGRSGSRSVEEALRRAYRSRDPQVRLNALQSLHKLLGGEESWKEELRSIYAKAKGPAKILAIDLLAELQDQGFLPEIYKLFDHKDWVVRAAAYDYCRRVRSLDSVDPLIARFDKERGRMKEDLEDALKAITSYRMLGSKRWRDWWKEEKGRFKMPPLAVAVPKRSKPSGAARTVSSFFNIPLVSTRVVFVLDISGSMSSPIGTQSSGGAGRTRLDEAKKQLQRVVEGIPDRALFNLIYFDTPVNVFQDKVQRASRRSRAEALRSIAKLEPRGGTNIHDALEKAFEDPKIDTIYLLSDGSPSAGKITDPQLLADTVRDWNRSRKIRIHTIAIGSKSKLMERLADESGGEHSHVR